MDINLSHAYIAVMKVLDQSDSISPAYVEVVANLLLKAVKTERAIECPHCGSTDCTMSSYEPLDVDSFSLGDYQYTRELWSTFECHNCTRLFSQILKVSH